MQTLCEQALVDAPVANASTAPDTPGVCPPLHRIKEVVPVGVGMKDVDLILLNKAGVMAGVGEVVRFQIGRLCYLWVHVVLHRAALASYGQNALNISCCFQVTVTACMIVGGDLRSITTYRQGLPRAGRRHGREISGEPLQTSSSSQ